MSTRTLILLTAVSTLFAAGCNDQALIGNGQANDPPSTSDTNAPDPTPTATPDEPVGQEGDWDGDGIPDEDDNLPCLAIYLRVDNTGVSSAEVLLNDEIVVDHSLFPTDEIIEVYINPVSGENVLEVGGKLNGSPDDVLLFHIADTEGYVYLNQALIREPGTPKSVAYTFNVDVDCEGF